MRLLYLILFTVTFLSGRVFSDDLPLYYWRAKKFENFGDYLSVEIVQRIIGRQVEIATASKPIKPKLLALGSILYFAREGDTLWGTGMNAKYDKREDFSFRHLDVRSVRGPLTRQFLMDNFDADVPEIYGDPALLFPALFPEYKRKDDPKYSYIIIPHYSDVWMYPKEEYPNVVYPYEPWDEVVLKILDSQFVISSSLHGLIIAEAYGIGARWLRVSSSEPEFKFLDYYLGTGRSLPQYAQSITEAMDMGPEEPCECDLEMLYKAFPFDKFR